MIKGIPRGVTIVTALLLATSCAPRDSLADLTPAEALSSALDHLEDAGAFRFRIEYSGPEVLLTAGVTLSRIDGTFAAPGSADSEIRVKARGLTTIIEVISIGEKVWQRDALNPEWALLDSRQSFSAAELFTALPLILTEDIRSLRWEEIDERLEEFPGERLDVLAAVVEGNRLQEVTFGLIGGAEARVWLAGTEPRRVELNEPRGRRWTIDLWDHGTKATIAPPS